MTSASPARTLDDTRFDCSGCTACCRHFALGPVRPHIIAQLRDLHIERDWAPAAAGFAVQRPGPDGEPAWFLRRRSDGACVFLRDDGLCAVHALHGASAKPSFCREYPFMVLDGPIPAVVVRADCGGWAHSFADGTPAHDQAAAILKLDRAHPPGTFHLDPVPILPGMGIAQAQFDAVERALIAPLTEPRSAAHATSACADILYELVGRDRPIPEPARAEHALRACVDHLLSALEPALAAPPDDDPDTRGMVVFLRSAVELLQAGASLQPRPLDPSAQAYLGLVLRNELVGRLFQSYGGLPPWLGSVVLGARIAAAATPGSPDEPVSARALGPRYATWVRLTRHQVTRRLLHRMQPALIDLFSHAHPTPGS